MNREPGSPLRYLIAGVGMLLLLAEAPFAFASGLLAPLWAVVGIVALWAVFVVLGVRWFKSAPGRVLALPFLGAVIWFGVLSLGEAFLGWTG